MKIGQKPYLVGEEGPELIMPRANGDGYVLPADVTQQLLPMMTKRPTPRNVGGPMTMESRGGTFRGFEGTSSSGQPAMGFASNIPTAMMTPDAIARAQGDSVFVDPMDGRYQLDPNQPGMPMMPDVVTGPFAEPGMPAPPREQMRSQIGQSLQSLNRMPGVRAANQVTDQATGEVVPFDEMLNRVTERGMMYGADYLDRQARDRTQLDLANRAARAPIGTPTMLPGQGSEARIQANLARQMERLSRTPEGAMLLAQQQQQMDMLAQRSRLASTAIPVKDAEGNILGYTTGTGASLPNIRPQQSMTAEEAEQYGLQPVGTYSDGSIKYGQPKAATTRGYQLIPGTYDAAGNLTPERNYDPYTGTTWNVGDPVPAEVTAARGGTASSSPQAAPTGPVKVNSPEEARALKPGTKFITSDGRTGTR
jgi:hypothetical protein